MNQIVLMKMNLMIKMMSMPFIQKHNLVDLTARATVKMNTLLKKSSRFTKPRYREVSLVSMQKKMTFLCQPIQPRLAMQQ